MTPDEPSHVPETAAPPDPSTSPPPAPRRRLPRWVVIGAASAGLLLLALVIAQAKLTQIASRTIQSALSAQLNLPVSIQKLSVHWFPAAVILEQMQIDSPDQEPAPLLTTTTVEVRFSVLSLLADRIIIHRITIEAPRLELNADRIDRLRPRTGSPGKGGPVIIRQITLHDGAIRYIDPMTHTHTVIDQLEASLDFGLLTDQATLQLSKGQLSVEQDAWRQHFTSMSGQATWTPKRVTLRRVVVDGPEGRYALDGTVALDATTPALQLTLTASMPLGRFTPWLPAGHTWDGLLGLEATIAGPWAMDTDLWHTASPLSIAGRLDVANLAIDGLSIGHATTQWQLNQGHLLLTRLTGSVLHGDLNGSAALSLPPLSPAIEATVDWSGLKAHPLLQRFASAAEFPDGRFNGHLALRGAGWAFAEWEGQGTIAFVATEAVQPLSPPSVKPDPVREAWRRLAQLTVDGQWHASRLTLHRAELVSRQGNRLIVEGTADYQGPLALSGSLHVTDLGEIGGWAMASGIGGLNDWTGVVTGQSTITGTWNHPRLAGSLTTQSLQRYTETIDGMHAAFSYEGGTVTVRDGRIRQQTGQAAVNGTMTVPPTAPAPSDRLTATHPQFQLSMTVTDGELGRILRLFDVALPIDGLAAATLVLTGSSEDFHLQGPVHISQGRLFGQPIDESDLILDVTSDGITLSRVVLTEGNGTVRGSGRIGFDDSYHTELVVDTVPLDQIAWLHAAAPQISGVLSGTLSGSGTWDAPHAKARVELTKLAAGPAELGRGTVTLQLAGERLDVTAELEEPQLTVEGAVHVRDDLPATFRLRVTRFPFALLLRPFVPAWPEQITLTASGEGELTGSLVRPTDLSGRFSVSVLDAQLAGYPVANDGPIELVLTNGRVTAQQVRFTGEGTTLAVEGSLTLFERYDLFIHGEAELAILRLFVPGISYGRGKAYLALQMTDDWLAPTMAGGINIQAGQVRLEAVDQPLSVSYAGLVFNGRQLVLDDLHGGVGKGTVQASGRIELRGLHPAQYRILMEVSGVPIAPIDGLSGVIDGSLWFQGEWPDPTRGGEDHHLLKGDLQLVRATYSKRIDLKSILKEQPAFETVTLSLPSFLNTVVLQIHVWGRQAVWIRNNIATLPLDLDLEVRGTVEHPVIIGRVFTTGGTFTFLHTPFQVSQGSIDFLDPKQTRPVVDLKASATVRNYQIDLALTGRPERIDLALSSDPVLSQADILSVMTVGRTSEEVSTAGAGTVATSEAASLLVSEFLEEPVQHIGIDRFQIDSAVDRSGLTVGPQLTIGKELIDDRLLFLYSRPFDPITPSVYRLEYQVNRHISLVAEGDESGRLGGDVKFRFDFR